MAPSSGAAPSTLTALVRLLDGAHLATPGDLSRVAAAAAAALGAEAAIYLADYQQRQLTLLPLPGADPEAPMPIDGTLPGKVFRELEPHVSEREARRIWVPLVDGTERLGVLALTVRDDRDLGSAGWREQCRWLATMIAHLISVKSPYGDALDAVRRSAPRTVAAELLWQLLPPQTFGTDGFVVSCMLEPAAGVAGDAFDYSVSGTTAHLAIFDATGHDLTAGLVSSVAVAAGRNSRRNGGDLQDCVRQTDRAIAGQFRQERYVTAVHAELDRASGVLRYVASGHPPPLLLRQGKVVKSLSEGRRPLLGLDTERLEVGVEQLEPGDWLVCYTDGITEARNPRGEEFGRHRLVDMLERAVAAEQPAPETLRRLVQAVMKHQEDVLQDDATILIAQWRTGSERDLYAP